MATTITQTHTTTGAKDAIDVPTMQTLTVALVGDATDFVANIETQLVPNGNWVLAEAALADSTPKTTTGPVNAVRVNITGLGTATTIDFEVVGQRHG